MFGIFTASMRNHMDPEYDGMCVFCKQQRESWEHLWWHCPAFDSDRAEVWQGEVVDASKLPGSIRNAGVMPAHMVGLGCTWWGQRVDEGIG
eukprot:1458292-Alexandrium_andersonii.AAC.1